MQNKGKVLKNYYSITPLAYLNAANDTIELDYCAIIKISEEELKDRFQEYEVNDYSYRQCVGVLFPSEWEIRKIKDQFYICFQSEGLFRKHFQFYSIALRLLDKFPAKTTKTFTKKGSSGKLDFFDEPLAAGKFKNIPEYFIPEQFKKIAEKYRKNHYVYSNKNHQDFQAYRNWRRQEYGRSYLKNEYIHELNSLEGNLIKLFVDRKKDRNLDFLRIAIWWYCQAQDADYKQLKIIESCLILEHLLLSEAGAGRGKSQKLQKNVASFLCDNYGEKRRIKKIIETIYNHRNDLVHGTSKHPIPDENEKAEFLDMPRLAIKAMLNKTIIENQSKQEILEYLGKLSNMFADKL